MVRFDFRGKVAFVTGAAAGIGRATALAFGRAGAAVIVSDVNAEGGADTVGMIEKAGGRAAFHRCDVSNGSQVTAAVGAAVDRYGRLDFAFNNAGINAFGDDEYIDDNWARSIGINLTGVMLCMREQAEVMLKSGGGAIVNMSSINGIVGNPDQPAYTASKHGVIGLTRHAALRWARAGIRVNAVCPGVIETAMTAPLVADPEMRERVESMTPMGRMGRAEEISNAVLWLCSDASSFVTGHPLVVDGGATAI